MADLTVETRALTRSSFELQVSDDGRTWEPYATGQPEALLLDMIESEPFTQWLDETFRSARVIAIVRTVDPAM